MMSLRRKLAAFAVGMALVVSADVARAEAPPAPKTYPAFTARRMVLPERVIMPYSNLLVVPASTPEGSTSVGLNLGMMYGVGPGWMLDAAFVPLKLGPSFGYGNPEFALTREVTRTQPFELSLSGRVLFRSNTSDSGPLGGIELGAPMFFRLTEHLRLDVATYLPVSVSQRPIGSLGVTRAGLRVPVSLYYQLHPSFVVGLATGLNARDLGDVAGSYSVPATLSIGYATTVNGFLLDLFPYVTLPAFYGQAGLNTKTVALGLFVDLARRL